VFGNFSRNAGERSSVAFSHFSLHVAQKCVWQFNQLADQQVVQALKLGSTSLQYKVTIDDFITQNYVRVIFRSGERFNELDAAEKDVLAIIEAPKNQQQWCHLSERLDQNYSLLELESSSREPPGISFICPSSPMVVEFTSPSALVYATIESARNDINPLSVAGIGISLSVEITLVSRESYSDQRLSLVVWATAGLGCIAAVTMLLWLRQSRRLHLATSEMAAGVSSEQLIHMPAFTIPIEAPVKWAVELFGSDEADCSICFSAPVPGHPSKLRQLPCSHVFHRDCIDQWFKNNISCPLCRKPAVGIEHICPTPLPRWVVLSGSDAPRKRNRVAALLPAGQSTSVATGNNVKSNALVPADFQFESPLFRRWGESPQAGAQQQLASSRAANGPVESTQCGSRHV
jgi:hypothetical protein